MFFIVPASNSNTKPKKPYNVELDLDDAPFLEEPEPEPEPEPAPKPIAKPKKTQEKTLPAVGMPPAEKPTSAIMTFLREKKKMLIIVASLLLVSFIAVSYFIFSPPSTPPVAEIEPRRITLPAAPVLDDAPTLPQFITKWQPFTIPLRGNDGEIVLFTMTLSLPTDDPMLHGEIMARQIILRDAIYYYLSRRPLEELMNKNNAESLRLSIVGVLNEHLTSGKITSIYVEDYYAEHL